MSKIIDFILWLVVALLIMVVYQICKLTDKDGGDL